MKSFLFELGHQPALSAEELLRQLAPAKPIELTDQLAIFQTDLEPSALLKTLGGTIKIAEVIAQGQSLEALEPAALDFLIDQHRWAAGAKIVFGLSQLGVNKKKSEIKDWGLKLKRRLEERSWKVRFVFNRQAALSSVVISKNQLLDRELILAQGKSWHLAVTRAVQDFEAYGERDYGRPARHTRRGMLPPKLAQIMINLAGQPRGRLLDPFCGVGTLIQEAYLRGWPEVVGSDIDQLAIKASTKNLQRLKSGSRTLWKLKQVSVANLSQAWPARHFRAIISEPYLGPARELSTTLSSSRWQAIEADLRRLYSQAFSQFAKILEPDGLVVMIWPVFYRGQRPELMPLIDQVTAAGFQQQLPLVARTNLNRLLSERQTLLYHRPGQLVGREITVWRRGSTR